MQAVDWVETYTRLKTGLKPCVFQGHEIQQSAEAKDKEHEAKRTRRAHKKEGIEEEALEDGTAHADRLAFRQDLRSLVRHLEARTHVRDPWPTLLSLCNVFFTESLMPRPAYATLSPYSTREFWPRPGCA